MPLHPVIAAALLKGANVPPYHTLPLTQARAQAKQAYVNDLPQIVVADVRDLTIPGPAGPMALRVYSPAGDGPHPVLVFFHGSGFVVLDLDSHDEICRRLCVGAACVVVSIDYRLAPEHRFPAGPDDCLFATRWVADHATEFNGDASRLAVCGDSAGGCLAAVTALRLRDEGGPSLRAQLLFYPVTDHYSAGHASFDRYGTGHGLTAEGMRWFWDQYLADGSVAAEAGSPNASPLRATSLAGLPPAFVQVAEYDVLRDEGEAFAAQLSAAGVPVVMQCRAGMNHGYLKYAGLLDEAGGAMNEACAWLAKNLRA